MKEWPVVYELCRSMEPGGKVAGWASCLPPGSVDQHGSFKLGLTPSFTEAQ